MTTNSHISKPGIGRRMYQYSEHPYVKIEKAHKKARSVILKSTLARIINATLFKPKKFVETVAEAYRGCRAFFCLSTLALHIYGQMVRLPNEAKKSRDEE